MQNYDSMNEAVTDLKARGYTADFEVKSDGIKCNTLNIWLNPGEFTIDEFYRFEGDTDPDESSIVYAVSSASGIKGTITDAYGVYAAITPEMAKKLLLKPY